MHSAGWSHQQRAMILTQDAVRAKRNAHSMNLVDRCCTECSTERNLWDSLLKWSSFLWLSWCGLTVAQAGSVRWYNGRSHTCGNGASPLTRRSCPPIVSALTSWGGSHSARSRLLFGLCCIYSILCQWECNTWKWSTKDGELSVLFADSSKVHEVRAELQKLLNLENREFLLKKIISSFQT